MDRNCNIVELAGSKDAEDETGALHPPANMQKLLDRSAAYANLHSEDPHVLSRDASVREMLKPLFRYLQQDGATELCVNSPGRVFVEVGAQWLECGAPELTLNKLLSLAQCIATFTDQEISPQKPILSAMLPDGERIQIVVPPAVEMGTVSMTIRVPSPSIKSLDQYETDGAFSRYVWSISKDLEQKRSQLDRTDATLIKYLKSQNLKKFLRLAVVSRKNIAVVGDTGSGKTTLMKSVCQEIPTYERLVTIEDVRELFLPNHPNRVHLLYSKGGQGVAKIDPSDLIASNMRMKPDRVLLAELRGGEAFDFLKLLTTGHSGSITSYHAESCALAAERYVFMSKEHPQAAIYDAAELKRLVTLTIDIIIHVVAKTIYNDAGEAIRKERFVSEVSFDPIAKLRSRFGDNVVVTAVQHSHE
jgi:type IV secretion system protein VirB11